MHVDLELRKYSLLLDILSLPEISMSSGNLNECAM